jgi:hypothetical protein
MSNLKVFKLGSNALQGSGSPPYEKEMFGASVEGVPLVAHGDTEDDAVRNLAEGLREFVICHRKTVEALEQMLRT